MSERGEIQLRSGTKKLRVRLSWPSPNCKLGKTANHELKSRASHFLICRNGMIKFSLKCNPAREFPAILNLFSYIHGALIRPCINTSFRSVSGHFVCRCKRTHTPKTSENRRLGFQTCLNNAGSAMIRCPCTIQFTSPCETA